MENKSIKELWNIAIKKGFTEQEIENRMAVFTVHYLGKLDKPERNNLINRVMEMAKLIIFDFDKRELTDEDIKEFDLLIDSNIKKMFREFFKELFIKK